METAVKLQRISRILVVVAAVTILVLSLLPKEAISHVSLSDKFLHFAAYATLSFLAYFSFIKSIDMKLTVIIIIVCFIYGATIELLQPLVGRNRENMDLLVNAAGVLVGTTFCILLDLFLRKIKRSIF
ncbi:MAG TPA: hypothetical protein ENH82_05870 [bacterium]|nr:hypothetical protein [bacterium]